MKSKLDRQLPRLILLVFWGGCFASSLLLFGSWDVLSPTDIIHLSFLHAFYTYELHEIAETRGMWPRQEQAAGSIHQNSLGKGLLHWPFYQNSWEARSSNFALNQCRGSACLVAYLYAFVSLWCSLLELGRTWEGRQKFSLMLRGCVRFPCFIPILYVPQSLQGVGISRILLGLYVLGPIAFTVNLLWNKAFVENK